MLNTEAAMDRRWAILQEALASPVAMAELIEAFSLVLNTREASTRKRIAAGHPIGNDGRYFRWHDAGDLASVEHLDAIVQIAVNCPRVSFWLPTRESKIVRAWCRANGVADPIEVAPNLVCRGSAAMIDGRAPDGFRFASGVHSRKGSPPTGMVECGAYENNGECGACRTCWDPNVAAVSYPRH
jgi:hypothetical protein